MLTGMATRTHAQRVCQLYRRGLINIRDWAVDRDLFIKHGLALQVCSSGACFLLAGWVSPRCRFARLCGMFGWFGSRFWVWFGLAVGSVCR